MCCSIFVAWLVVSDFDLPTDCRVSSQRLTDFINSIITVLRLHERWRSIVMSTSVYVRVCLFVCLSASISSEQHAWSFPMFVHVVYSRCSDLLHWVTKSQKEGAILGVLFSIDNALYSIIAFGIHTNIQKGMNRSRCRLRWWLGWALGTMCLLGTRHPRGMGNFWENVSAHCKVMGHSTVSCAKTAETIKIPLKTWLSRRNHVLDGVQISQKEAAIFRGCPGHWTALSIFAAAAAAPSLRRSLQKGSFNRQ